MDVRNLARKILADGGADDYAHALDIVESALKFIKCCKEDGMTKQEICDFLDELAEEFGQYGMGGDFWKY